MDSEPAGGGRVDNVVVVLLDSLNRHMLGSYGGTEFTTPHLDRFAARSTRFTRHQTGSLPCMPARHDILCGALDFLWKPWGSIELWEQPVTHHLRAAGVTTMLVSDHPHLFETGGENYHTDFSAWDYVRGHEGDPWRTRPDPSWVGTPAAPARSGGWPRPYDLSRTWFRSEDDFPGPRTMQRAADWIRTAAPHHDRWLLFVDEFDPHEPFDTPEPWQHRYDPDWDGELIIWPPYDVGAVRKGRLSEREARHLRANYGAKLSMIDHWFGQVLDALDEQDLWATTAVIVGTDHGHYLGEKDIWGKPAVMQYEPLGHIPLMVHWPGSTAAPTCDALTTNVDVCATLADAFGVELGHRTHGVSLVPLLTGAATAVREWAIGGVWGNWVQVTDGRRKYARSAVDDNFPLSMWSNRWSTMPVHGVPGLELPRPDRRARLDAMPGTDVPVIRQPFAPGDRLPFWASGRAVDRHHLYDVANDPGEDENLAGTGAAVETEMLDLLRTALDDVDAPDDQYQRLGLT
jgi:arylsulfatase A-like enzyme